MTTLQAISDQELETWLNQARTFVETLPVKENFQR